LRLQGPAARGGVCRCVGVVEDLTAEHVFGRRAAATDRLVVSWLLRAYYTGGSGRNREVSAISSVTPILRLLELGATS
jgi:hypothetical protein